MKSTVSEAVQHSNLRAAMVCAILCATAKPEVVVQLGKEAKAEIESAVALIATLEAKLKP